MTNQSGHCLDLVFTNLVYCNVLKADPLVNEDLYHPEISISVRVQMWLKMLVTLRIIHSLKEP